MVPIFKQDQVEDGPAQVLFGVGGNDFPYENAEALEGYCDREAQDARGEFGAVGGAYDVGGGSLG